MTLIFEFVGLAFNAIRVLGIDQLDKILGESLFHGKTGCTRHPKSNEQTGLVESELKVDKTNRNVI